MLQSNYQKEQVDENRSKVIATAHSEWNHIKKSAKISTSKQLTANPMTKKPGHLNKTGRERATTDLPSATAKLHLGKTHMFRS